MQCEVTNGYSKVRFLGVDSLQTTVVGENRQSQVEMPVQELEAMAKIIVNNWLALANDNLDEQKYENGEGLANRHSLNSRFKKKDWLSEEEYCAQVEHYKTSIRGASGEAECYFENDWNPVSKKFNDMRAAFEEGVKSPIVSLAFRFGTLLGHSNLYPLTTMAMRLYCPAQYNEECINTKFALYNYIKAMELSEDWNLRTQDHQFACVSWLNHQDTGFTPENPMDYTSISHATATGRVIVNAVHDKIEFNFYSPSFRNLEEPYGSMTFNVNGRLVIEVDNDFDINYSRFRPFIDVLMLLNFTESRAVNWFRSRRNKRFSSLGKMAYDELGAQILYRQVENEIANVYNKEDAENMRPRLDILNEVRDTICTWHPLNLVRRGECLQIIDHKIEQLRVRYTIAEE